MKAGWEVKTLGEVCSFQRGLTYSKSDEVDISSNVVLRANNIDLKTNFLDFTELKYINANVDIADNKKVKKGSLIICTASGSKIHLGKVAYIDSDYGYAFGGFMGMLTPHSTLDSKFLFYLMTSEAYKEFIGALSDGANINNLKFDDLKKFQIPHPNFEQQQRIVAILDQALEGIAKARANAEQNLLNARALFESHLQSVFTQRGEWWVESTLDDVCDLITCGVAATPKYVDEAEGVPFLSAQNVRDGEVVLDKFRHISKEFHRELTKKNKPTKGDVLYSRVGSKFGEAGVVEHDFEFSVYVSLTLIKPKPAILNSYFLKHYLNSAYVKSIALKSISSSGVPNLNVKDVRQFPIKLPSISQQVKFVEEINELRVETQRLEALYQRKIACLDELKKSLLQQAFAGDL